MRISDWSSDVCSSDLPAADPPSGTSRADIKFSFGNPLDDVNEIRTPPPFQYVPEIVFRNQRWMDHLRDSRFPALAGWQKDYQGIFDVMNDVTAKAFSQFGNGGQAAWPSGEFGKGGKGFGGGIVHHPGGQQTAQRG